MRRPTFSIAPANKARLRAERRRRLMKALKGDWPEEIVRMFSLSVIEDTFDGTPDRGVWKSFRWHFRHTYQHYRTHALTSLWHFWHRRVLRQQDWEIEVAIAKKFDMHRWREPMEE